MSNRALGNDWSHVSLESIFMFPEKCFPNLRKLPYATKYIFSANCSWKLSYLALLQPCGSTRQDITLDRVSMHRITGNTTCHSLLIFQFMGVNKVVTNVLQNGSVNSMISLIINKTVFHISVHDSNVLTSYILFVFSHMSSRQIEPQSNVANDNCHVHRQHTPHKCVTRTYNILHQFASAICKPARFQWTLCHHQMGSFLLSWFNWNYDTDT